MTDALDHIVGDNTKQALKSYIERIENLEEDKVAVSDDIKEVYAEAKSDGFDTKIMRKVISRRKIEREELENQDSMVEVYEDTLASMEDLLA